MLHPPEIPDIHDATQTSIPDYRLEPRRLHADIPQFRALVSGKWDTASDENLLRWAWASQADTRGASTCHTHARRSVRSRLNPKKVHLEAKLLSFCLRSLPRSHSFCSLLTSSCQPPPPIPTHLSHCCYPNPPFFTPPTTLLFPLFSHKSDFSLCTPSSKYPRLFARHQTIPMKPKHFKLRGNKSAMLRPGLSLA